jgi:hypothetical protein
MEDPIVINVFDMTGKFIEKHNILPKDITEFKIGDNYTSGMYNVTVSQGKEIKNLKVIKN